MKKKLLILASVCLVVALVALSVISCAEPTPTGGTLRVAGAFDAIILGYPMGRMLEVPVVFACLETLVKFDETGALVPNLATSWEADAEAKTITLHLRKGVKFHDGTDFNAEAVKWNMDQFRLAGEREELDRVESIDILDDYTVRLNLSEMDALLMIHLAGHRGGMMISPTAYQTHGQEWCEKNPVGTGPFKFVSWEKDVSIKFERFDDYWQKGKPYLDAVEWLVIADPMVQLASFMAGEVDILAEVSPKDAKDVEASGKYELSMVPSDISSVLTDYANPDSIFTDIRLRRAIEYAIDKQAICDTIGYGYWEPLNQGARPGSWAYNPDVVGYPYNPDKARELLAEAGYPDGFKTQLHFLNRPADIPDSMTAVQGYLAEVGIDAELVQYDRGAWHVIAVKGGWPTGLANYPRGGLIGGELVLLNRFLGADRLFASVYREPEYRELLARAVTAPDFETQQALVWEMQKVGTDKYAMVCWHHVLKCIAAKHPQVHDDGWSETTPDQWTPEDAWIER